MDTIIQKSHPTKLLTLIFPRHGVEGEVMFRWSILLRSQSVRGRSIPLASNSDFPEKKKAVN
jgi:hypothetical protein